MFGRQLISFLSLSGFRPKSDLDRKVWRSHFRLFIDRAIAILILANLSLVVFDFIYLKNRHLYIRIDDYRQQISNTPQRQYLQLVDNLQIILEQEGLNSPQVDPILSEIRQSSIEILIKQPPFRVQDSHGTLAVINNRLREHLNTDDLETAINTFWSRAYFTDNGWENSLRFFNINLRHLFTLYEPQLSYDIIKGVEAYRPSQSYLMIVADLKAILEYEGLESPQVEPLLQQLQQLSTEMIDRSYIPQIDNTLGLITHIKYRMVEHIHSGDPSTTNHLTPTLKFLYSMRVLSILAPEVIWVDQSSREALRTFWSLDNFSQKGWETELDFFDSQIASLMRQMYFRHLGINGEFIDRFWLVDFPWVIVFWLIFLVELSFIRRRHPQLGLWPCIRMIWYDLFLLIGVIRLIRIIPVIIHLERAKLPNMATLRAQIKLKVIASFGNELIQVVVNQSISQLKATVSSGKLRKMIFKSQQKSMSITKPESPSQVKVISQQLLKVTACHVLPEIQQDLEAYLHYQVSQSVKQSGIYRRLQKIPVIRKLPEQVSDNLVKRIAALISQQPLKSYYASQNKQPDPIAQELQQRLVNRFLDVLRSELKNNETIQEVEYILIDFLDQAKINNVESAPPDPDTPALKPANFPDEFD
ncbi:hypothetical protein [Limnospira platensis]|uniref:hypothetical protein n=1 Tax=Limnospira platensis TaxID=118562 RepID=UPI00028043CD|nr:hypothetical protein SPLC1_S060780 [Arthrospira platensis C1]UWU50577.1 hypothetical protein APLC1_5494 [Arthrospira platensis C1]